MELGRGRTNRGLHTPPSGELACPTRATPDWVRAARTIRRCAICFALSVVSIASQKGLKAKRGSGQSRSPRASEVDSDLQSHPSKRRRLDALRNTDEPSSQIEGYPHRPRSPQETPRSSSLPGENSTGRLPLYLRSCIFLRSSRIHSRCRHGRTRGYTSRRKEFLVLNVYVPDQA
ncbi:hypothetical protein BV25DRAFT_1454957 [Artomyces pyxidatus]|uniref:Uncharacterized protein n=1 Tax=Artomyces pyxidatus TaxID=48021 RepID=A0ACB8SLN4_9AGAM|nr:hypothetical protein BV25DRAFT_1454957 [Artomyces pyxidatus]